MIAYLTDAPIADERMGLLCSLFEGLIVHLPSERLVSDAMRDLAGRRALDIRLPLAVDQARLDAVIADFNAWVQAHRHGGMDLKAVLSAYKSRPPLVEDTAPTQIRNQIRHFGEGSPDQSEDRLFRAALFLSLAFAFDQQQAAIESHWQDLKKEERRMFAVLTGDEGDLSIDAGSKPDIGADALDVGAARHGVRERIRAWATLVAADSRPPWGWVTTRSEVMDELLETLPESIALGCHAFDRPSADGGQGASGSDPASWMKTLAFSETLIPGEEPETETGGLALILYGVPRCPPGRALSRLGQVDDAKGMKVQTADPDVSHTILGLLKGIE